MISREPYALPPPPPSNVYYAPQRAAGDDEIDVHALLGTLVDHRWLIIIVTLVFLLISLAYVFLATPKYEAQAMVQVEQAPALTSLTGNNTGQSLGASNPEATDALSILTAGSVLKPAVDNLNLNVVIKPYRIPVIGTLIARYYTPPAAGDVASPWFGLNHYDWGGAKLDIPRLDVPQHLYGQDMTLIAGKNGTYSLYEDSAIPLMPGRLLLRGRVGQTATGSGVTIFVKNMRANPGTHFDVVRNYEVTTINQLQNAINVKQEGNDSNVISLTFDSASPTMAVKVLDQVTQAYLAQNVGRNAAQASSSLTFVQQQLPAVKAKLESAQNALNAFQTKAHSVDVGMQTQNLLTRIATTDASIQQLQTQLPEIERLYTPNHPAYKAIEKQIGQLQGEKAALQKQIDTFPDTQRQLLSLTGNVQVLNTTYNNLLNEAQQLEIAQAGTVGDARIADPPSVDITQPAKPKKLLVVLGGTILGAVLAVGYVFLRRMMHPRVEDAVEIEQLGLPVYASIPMSIEERGMSSRLLPHRFGTGRGRLLALEAPADPATEALRGLRTSLNFARREAENNIVMVSASSPDAGKTFISSNMATVMAQGGQKVLLIDANLRDGSLHDVLGVRCESGLSELIAGEIELSDAIRAIDGLDDLHFISRGRIPLYPSELLMNARFGVLLHKLAREYDMLVIDSPPILAVTDAAIIGGYAGTNLLVVRFGVNQSKEVELAKQRFKHSGVSIDGVVFNAVERRNANSLSYGYYGYPAAR